MIRNDHLLVTGAAGRVGRTLVPDLVQRFGQRNVTLLHNAEESQAVRRALLGRTLAAPTHVLLLHRPPDPVSSTQEAMLALDYLDWMRACVALGVRRVVVASSEHALLSPHTAYGAAKLRLEQECAAMSTAETLIYADRIGRVPDPDLGHDPEPESPVPLTRPCQLRARVRGLLGLPPALF